jgi:hypothetical protein
MFKELIESLKEAFKPSSPADFDTSDSPAEPTPARPKGPPKSVPLKAIRNVQKPISPIGSVLHSVGAKPRAKKLPGMGESTLFGGLIAEARSLVEGGGSRARKASRQDAVIKKTGADQGWKSAINKESPGFKKHLYRSKANKKLGGPDEYDDKLHVKHFVDAGWSTAKGAADAPLVRDKLKAKFKKA